MHTNSCVVQRQGIFSYIFTLTIPLLFGNDRRRYNEKLEKAEASATLARAFGIWGIFNSGTCLHRENQKKLVLLHPQKAISFPSFHCIARIGKKLRLATLEGQVRSSGINDKQEDSACDRDCTLLECQLAPWSTPSLRKRSRRSIALLLSIETNCKFIFFKA